MSTKSILLVDQSFDIIPMHTEEAQARHTKGKRQPMYFTKFVNELKKRLETMEET